MYHNTIVVSSVDYTILDATYRSILTVTDIAITHLTGMDNLDKSNDDEISFSGLFHFICVDA